MIDIIITATMNCCESPAPVRVVAGPPPNAYLYCENCETDLTNQFLIVEHVAIEKRT